MDNWHCSINGQQYGPVTLAELQEWARAGRVGPGDRRSSQGLGECRHSSPAEGFPCLTCSRMFIVTS